MGEMHEVKYGEGAQHVHVLSRHVHLPPLPHAHHLEVLFCSVTKYCPGLHDPMDGGTPGFRVHHHVL